jgi:hypothetical protein
VNIVFVYEGEEERGSGGFADVIEKNSRFFEGCVVLL